MKGCRRGGTDSDGLRKAVVFINFLLFFSFLSGVYMLH